MGVIVSSQALILSSSPRSEIIFRLHLTVSNVNWQNYPGSSHGSCFMEVKPKRQINLPLDHFAKSSFTSFVTRIKVRCAYGFQRHKRTTFSDDCPQIPPNDQKSKIWEGMPNLARTQRKWSWMNVVKASMGRGRSLNRPHEIPLHRDDYRL